MCKNMRTHQIVMSFSPPVEGCFLKKGGSQAPPDPPPPPPGSCAPDDFQYK